MDKLIAIRIDPYFFTKLLTKLSRFVIGLRELLRRAVTISMKAANLPAEAAPHDLVKLGPLMRATSGTREVVVGVIDGPVGATHSGLAEVSVRQVPGAPAFLCSRAGSFACAHGTMVVGILAAKRDSGAPGICPSCSFSIYPIFQEEPLGRTGSSRPRMPGATPDTLAKAITALIAGGARVVNLSAALPLAPTNNHRALEEALNLAAQKGMLMVAAVGNQGLLGSSPITRHRWVIPVAGCDRTGRPYTYTNAAPSTARQGVSAPAEGVTTLSADGGFTSFEGTSAAAPFVTGTIALLLSLFPGRTAAEIRRAVTAPDGAPGRDLFPRLLDATAAYEVLDRKTRR
jgi:subtilisin family serine protease